MKIAVVSDTHGHVPFTLEAVREIERRGADLVIHCGDIGGTEVVALFAALPTRFVVGNVDRDEQALRQAVSGAGLTFDGEFGEVEIVGKRVAFLHGHDGRRLTDTFRGGEYDLVCHGHTHKRRWEKIGSTWALNPGALFRANPHGFAIVTVPDLEVEFVTLPGGS